jgi:DNA-binding NarL/FixJ family response regulator
MTKKIRILVVDDQTVVREGIAAILSFQSDMEVVAEAEDGGSWRARLARTSSCWTWSCRARMA